MQAVKRMMRVVVIIGLLFTPAVGFSAYHHMTDTDSLIFKDVYPDSGGTKLDSCAACHTGGNYVNNGKTVSLGSCQWCHYVSGYKTKEQGADFFSTLNPYGVDYQSGGRDAQALTAIEGQDSDGDSYSNLEEILALRFQRDPTESR